MKTHTLTVRDRRLSWDDRTLVRGSVAADRVEVALDDEYKACDTVHAVMVSAAHPQPVRMAVEDGAYTIPSELTRETGSILTCLIGYVGDVQRVTSEQESQPLVVTKSGPVCGTDPEQEQPDLWRQLMETVEESKRIALSVRDDADAGRFDGADGETGPQGPAGAPGRDGTSPTASVTQTETGATITVTDASGTTMAEVRNGRDGTGGEVADNSVTNVKLADNAVNSRTLADGAVTRAKLAQDALVKAGAGISIADDGTTEFNPNPGTFYFENNGRVNIHAKAIANNYVNGATYYSGISTPTQYSEGTVQWFMAGTVVVVVPRTAVTLNVPAEWSTTAKLPFATFATGAKISKPISNARIAQIMCDEGWFYLDADVATDGTVTLSLFVTSKQAGTAIHIKQTGFTQLVLPICGGGWRISTN